MSEQALIIEKMQALVMRILKSGSATEEEGNELDELEALMLEQKCYRKVDNSEQSFQGEEIANFFFTDNSTKAIDKMLEYGITADDFFGFAEYHYDEDEDEQIEMFTDEFIANASKEYDLRSKANL